MCHELIMEFDKQKCGENLFHLHCCARLCVVQYFADLRNSIVNSQPPEKQQAMHLCFENLMEGIERNLLTKNRDRSVMLIDCHHT